MGLKAISNAVGGGGGTPTGGPGTSTDRAIATWNGTGGNLLRDNPQTAIDANGNTTLANLNVTGSTIPTNGISLSNANTVAISSNGTNQFFVFGTSLGGFNAAASSLVNAAASNTTPTLIPRRAASTTGFGAQAAGNISTIVAGVEVERTTATNAVDGATVIFKQYNFGGNSHASYQGGQTTTGVAAVATSIFTTTGDGTILTVCGSDGTNRFSDLVSFGLADTPAAISTHTSAGAPAARTYTRSGSALQLAMASGTYAISAFGTITGQR